MALDYTTTWLAPKSNFVLNDLYFKTTCNIRLHFLGHMGGLKIEGPLYISQKGVELGYILLLNTAKKSIYT